MSTSKRYMWVVLVVGLIGIPAAAQTRPAAQTRRAQTTRSAQITRAQNMSASARATVLNTTVATTCAQTAPAAPRIVAHDAKVFTPDRVANTLHGVWIGKVSGEFDPQLMSKDGFLNVDYYMIVDIKRGESFVYEEFSDKRSGAGLQAKRGAPKWTYVWCAKEDYKTKSPRQVHEFTKVSDDVNDARRLLNNSLGLKLGGNDEVVLSDIWKKLVDARFFDDPSRSLAYAGVLFKPITMGSVKSSNGDSLFELRLVGEYRGSGQTAAQFVPGNPIHNVEQAHFVGFSMSGQEVRQLGRQAPSIAAEVDGSGSADFLTASVELGNAMIGPKDDAVAAVFSTQMSFDKVVIGPLSPDASASLPKSGAGASLPKSSARATSSKPRTNASSPRQRK